MPSDELQAFFRALSSVIGWTYEFNPSDIWSGGAGRLNKSTSFIAWSASFYPQPILNFRRRSCTGLAVDFSVANIFGLSAYTIHTSALYFCDTVREQYRLRNSRHAWPATQVNDVVYAAHGLVLVSLTYSQLWPRIWGFEVGPSQRASRIMLSICFGSLGLVGLVAVMAVAGGHADTLKRSDWLWLDVVNGFGFMKLLLTLSKYCPQLYVNFQRRSTKGFSISQVLLDFSGGILSILQLFIDTSLAGNWRDSMGNVTKFMLANITLVFDLCFFLQHYVLYGPVDEKEQDSVASSEESPLLSEEHHE